MSWKYLQKLDFFNVKYFLAIEPTVLHHEFVHKLYESLKEKIAAQERIAEQAIPMEAEFESPIKNVPMTPMTPHHHMTPHRNL